MRALPLALLLAACAPGQLFLYVDTDAPVPPAPGEPLVADRPPALFDQLRIEILRDGEPALADGAQRDFSIHAGLFREGRASIGIAPPTGDAGLSARVRLFRGDRLVDGEPPIGSTLDTTVALPALGASGDVEASIVLRVDDVGSPLGQPEPIAATPGRPGPSLVGSWPGAARVPCSGSAMPDEVCVPGGAFWMGQPGYVNAFTPTPELERLVVVSPFFLDATELTVGVYRAHVELLTTPYNPTTNDLFPGCSATTSPGAFESYPLNCAPKEIADDYCRAVGKILPTEAQYELVASGRGLEQLFPWGNDEATCTDAIYGYNPLTNTDQCGAMPTGPGMQPPGSGLLDRVVIDGQQPILDLAGNLDEIMRDGWSDTPGGSSAGILYDPSVPSGGDTDDRAVRGGNWGGNPGQLLAANRQPLTGTKVSVSTGFRCARAGN